MHGLLAWIFTNVTSHLLVDFWVNNRLSNSVNLSYLLTYIYNYSRRRINILNYELDSFYSINYNLESLTLPSRNSLDTDITVTILTITFRVTDCRSTQLSSAETDLPLPTVVSIQLPFAKLLPTTALTSLMQITDSRINPLPTLYIER